MVDEKAPPPADKPAPSAGGDAAGSRKELEGFKVQIRREPAPTAGPPPVALFVVALVVAVGIGYGALKLLKGSPPADQGVTRSSGSGLPAEGTEGQIYINDDGTWRWVGSGWERVLDTDGGGADTPVEPWVWERLTFLEQEGRLNKALEFAEEQLAITPNSRLRTKVNEYRRSLGVSDAAVGELGLPQLLEQAMRSLRSGNLDEAIEAADEALQRDPDSAQAYRIRGEARLRQEDKLGATSDLQSALDLGFEPAGEVERLLEQARQP